jgi:non-canonical purine NTP pyrophosphatase (RdgB/HAM1 family)
MKKYVNVITKNKGKLLAAQSVFSKYDIEIKSLDFDLPEIQADTSIEIAKYTAREAWEKFHEPVIREDHSFFIDELGIPGPYMSYMEKQINIDSLIKILKTLDKRTGHWTVGTAFIDKNGKLYEFTFDVPIIFELEPRGKKIDNWVALIRFVGETRVLTEYSEEERLHIWNINYEKIAKIIYKQD